MPTVSSNAIKSLINYLSKRGLNRNALLSEIKLTDKELNEPMQFFDSKMYELLYSYASEYPEYSNLGFNFGKEVEPDRWGVLGYLVFSSPNFSEAISCLQRYNTLVGDFGTSSFKDEGEFFSLTWMPTYQCSYHLTEETITGWVAFAQKVLPKPLALKKVYFTHESPIDITIYEDFFSCPVVFSKDFNGIEFEAGILDEALGKYDVDIFNLLKSQADINIGVLAQSLSPQMVSQFIRFSLDKGLPDVEAAAQHFQLSVRSFQRKLTEHQVTFSDLIALTRKEMAEHYLLHTELSLISISEALVFSESSAFQRAFKRWTGLTPGQFRERVNKGDDLA